MMNPSLAMTLTLAGALVANLLTKLWLNSRQVRHVARHRAEVPVAFADTIGLDAHQKAADYTLAKARVNLVDLALDALALIGWTLLGGLDALNQLTLNWLGDGMTQQIALVVGFSLIGGLIGLPLSLYQTFGIEQRFGFNHTTPKLWISDVLKGLLVGMVLGLPILWLVLWLMQAGGPLWWFYTWAALVAYQLFVMWIAPNVIMPLFNKFTPLEDDTLKQQVSELMARAGFTAKPEQLQSIPISGIGFRWHVDLAGPFPKSSRGHTFIMIAVEAFTKHLEVVPIINKEAATVAYAFLHHVVAEFGAPGQVVTDSGTEFEGRFAQLLEDCMIDHAVISKDHPQANGQAEKMVQTVKKALMKMCADKKTVSNWDEQVAWISLGYRCSPQRSTDFSPYELLYARKPVVPPAL